MAVFYPLLRPYGTHNFVTDRLNWWAASWVMKTTETDSTNKSTSIYTLSLTVTVEYLHLLFLPAGSGFKSRPVSIRFSAFQTNSRIVTQIRPRPIPSANLNELVTSHNIFQAKKVGVTNRSARKRFSKYVQLAVSVPFSIHPSPFCPKNWWQWTNLKTKSCLLKKNCYLHSFDSGSFPCMFPIYRKAQVGQLLGQMLKPINRRKPM
jgi:hypothetical protein